MDFHDELLKELLEESKDYRKYSKRKRTQNYDSPLQRSHKRKPLKSKLRHRKKDIFGIAPEQGLTCPGRLALAVYLRPHGDRGKC